MERAQYFLKTVNIGSYLNDLSKYKILFLEQKKINLFLKYNQFCKKPLIETYGKVYFYD